MADWRDQKREQNRSPDGSRENQQARKEPHDRHDNADGNALNEMMQSGYFDS